MKRPNWYTDEHDAGWQKVRAAFSRDWEQTKHDFGSDTARDLDQDAGDTIRQATGGAREGFDKHEDAFRFGYAAQRNFKSRYPTWNDELDTQLSNDYGGDYARDRSFIRNAYEYRYAAPGDTGTRDESRL